MSRFVHIALSLLFVIFVLAAMIISVLGYLFHWEWTGFTDKRYWHWLELVIAPILLTGGGFLLYSAWTSSDHRLAEKRANEATRDANLNNIAKGYIDEIEQLLLKTTDQDKAQSASPSDPVSIIEKIARARTLNVLEGLDQKRRGSIIRFLHDASLLEQSELHFFIRLKGANLHGAHLSGANLNKAILSETVLEEADLSGTDLRGASLRNTNLSGADLREAALSEADLSGADLSGADLSDAKGVADGQVATCKSLKGATMPYGQQYEDWLKTPPGREWLNRYKKGARSIGRTLALRNRLAPRPKRKRSRSR